VSASRAHLADELLRRFAAAVRSAQLYSAGHPIIARNLEALTDAVRAIHAFQPLAVIGIVGTDVIVDEMPMAKTDTLGPLVRRLQQSGVERLSIEAGVAPDELGAFIEALIAAEPRSGDDAATPFPPLAHIRIGRVTVERSREEHLTDIATIRRLYNDAVAVAGDLWSSAQTEGKPDATLARTTVDGLAHAVAENRPALLALTTLQQYDNYTFTHMVNVSILTMGQARGLGLDGALLRELGLAALMHDIGKVRTPLDILTKPEQLTDKEMVAMRRHTVDGAEILRQTPDVPALAPVVAFEHHLRVDGSGYPEGVSRTQLNIATMLCSIADVYDAMRSQRIYQKAFPTDRILAVLKRNDGRQFDQHLVRRFVQLIGIYPAGTLVRLTSGEIAVVLQVYAPDPFRPRVRVIVGRDGARLDIPYDVNLWEPAGERSAPPAVAAPVDAAEYHVDPLALM
jgi:putative nucleotidyltransferase with HDIG domain